ncbi:hypothetical protein HF086_017821 [Spodoptera exigua]|uniref:Uncharacterized protein n=1 Tax=Spodoptera exigua TaxID=7107 RepID=A0A922S8Y1_SPOEX|nr:hypothetical protein HF086_017821 [Spodoptera exigua]
MSPYEGGVRVVGLLWSANLNSTSHYWDGYMHITDWLPTLLSAAGVEPPKDVDGVDQWESINTNSASQRKELFEIDDYTGYASVTYGDYKMIIGEPIQSYSGYLGGDLRGIIGSPPSYVDAIADSTVFGVLHSIGRTVDTNDFSLRNRTVIKCDVSSNSICYPSNDTVCLFNIIEDPCETTDLSATYPDLVASMLALLDVEMSKRIPRVLPVVIDPLSAPRLHNYTWDTWIN